MNAVANETANAVANAAAAGGFSIFGFTAPELIGLVIALFVGWMAWSIQKNNKNSELSENIGSIKTAVESLARDGSELKTGLKEVREEVKEFREELKGEINGLREEVKSEINGLREEVKEVREEVKSEIKEVREELKVEIKDVKKESSEAHAQIGKNIESARLELKGDITRVDTKVDQLLLSLIPKRNED